MTIRLSADAADPKAGMTLAELAEFVDRARAAGAGDTDRVRATANIRGRVKTLTLVPATPDAAGRT